MPAVLAVPAEQGRRERQYREGQVRTTCWRGGSLQSVLAGGATTSVVRVERGLKGSMYTVSSQRIAEELVGLMAWGQTHGVRVRVGVLVTQASFPRSSYYSYRPSVQA